MSIIAKAADAVLAYKFIRKLTTPFDKTEAFKLGIIDDKGKILKKKSERKTPAEKDSMSYMDTLIFNMKKLLAKVGGSGRIATLAAALLLLKEHTNVKMLDMDYAEQKLLETFGDEEKMQLFEDQLAEWHELDAINILLEDVTTAAGDSTVHSQGGTMDRSDPVLGKKKEIKMSQFAGKTCFEVDQDTFHKCRVGKKKYSRYESYVGNDEIGEAIRSYGRKNPKHPIILKDSKSGSMLYLKYGKK